MNIFSGASTKEDRDDLLVYKSIDILALERTSIFGVPIDNVNRDEAIACVLAEIEKKSGAKHVLFLDPLKLLKIRLNRNLHSFVENTCLTLPEGGGLLWAARQLRSPLKERISIIAFMLDAIRLAAYNDFTVYLLNEKPGYLDKVFTNLRRSFPGVRIIGRQEDCFGRERESLVKESLRKSSPDLVFLGMKFPLQEIWIQKNKKYLSNSIIIGVDQGFEVLSGIGKKAPNWLYIRGFDWIWNVITQPWRPIGMLLMFSFYMVTFLKSFRRKKKDKSKAK